MVDFALPRQLQAIGHAAIAEAVRRGAGAVEAEHLLLALLAERRGALTALVAPVGLDYDVFDRALDAERERSLAIAGLQLLSAVAPTSSTPRSADPGWGASVRDVLRGADKRAAKNGRPAALERSLAASILEAQVGTVPRALALAGLDAGRLRSALGAA